jgi:hypothetical protein
MSLLLPIHSTSGAVPIGVDIERLALIARTQRV